MNTLIFLKRRNGAQENQVSTVISQFRSLCDLRTVNYLLLINVNSFQDLGGTPLSLREEERGEQKRALAHAQPGGLDTQFNPASLSCACEDMEAQRFRPTSLESGPEMGFLEGSGDTG